MGMKVNRVKDKRLDTFCTAKPHRSLCVSMSKFKAKFQLTSTPVNERKKTFDQKMLRLAYQNKAPLRIM